MKDIKIRKLRRSDVNECAKMAIESFGKNEYPPEQYKTMKSEFMAAFTGKWWGRPTYFVAVHKKKIVGMGGYALSWLDWDTFEFFWLSVHKDYKNKGIGKALIAHRERDVLKQSAFKDDITITFSCTKKVIPYHEKNGYKVLIEKAAGKEVLMGKTFLKPKKNKK